MIHTCKLCDTEVEDNKHYFSTHKLSMKDYFESEEPRFDLFTKEPIPFTSPETYVLSDFLNKNNCQSYIDGLSDVKKKEYCRDLLIRRKEIKGLVYSPTQVELRSVISPSIIFYNKLFGNYYKLCEELGFKNRFKYFDKNFKIPLLEKRCKTKIIIDTREQNALKFDFPNKIGTLNYADYELSNDKLSNKVVVERKSIIDFISSFGSNIERLKNMLRRAHVDGAFVVVLVETTIEKALHFNEMKFIKDQVRATPSFIWHNVRTILQDFPNVQFLFADGRKECATIVEMILFSGGIFRGIDLQLLRDYQGIFRERILHLGV